MYKLLFLAYCIAQFTVEVEKPFTVHVETPNNITNKKEDYYIVMFSAKWCGPCQTIKKSGKLDKLKSLGYPVTVIDIDKDKSFYRGSIPKFWICKNQVRVHDFPAGAISPDTIIAKIKDLSEQTAN